MSRARSSSPTATSTRDRPQPATSADLATLNAFQLRSGGGWDGGVFKFVANTIQGRSSRLAADAFGYRAVLAENDGG